MVGSTKAARPSLFAKRPDLPRDVDEWVALALAIDPEERFHNVRALWNAFLATFHVEPRGKRGSFWAKATGMVKELAGMPLSAPSADPPVSSDPSLRTTEPSFISAALARSMMHVPEAEQTPTPTGPMDSTDGAEEKTIERVEKTIELPRPPTATPEKKIEIPIETTVELSSTSLLPYENTLPDPTRLDTAPQSKKPVSSKSKKKETPKSANSKRGKKSRRGKSSRRRKR
jgi:hypothetical protein